MFVKVVNFLFRAKQISTIDSATSLMLIREAQVLDKEVACWPLEIPPSWHPKRLNIKEAPPAVTKAGIYDNHLDVYPNINICSRWNNWRLIRIKIHAFIAGLDASGSNVFQPLSSVETRARTAPTIQPRTHNIHVIRSLAEDICASLPFCLGSRTRSSPIYATDALYPTDTGEPATSAHQKAAIAWGGWLLLHPMQEILNNAMYLKPNLLAWLVSQMQRLADLYDVSNDEDFGLDHSSWG